MAKHDRPLLWGLQNELGSLVSDIREMALLRWQLAREELTQDAVAVRRLAIVIAVASLGVLSSLPLLAAALCCLLSGIWGISLGGWLLIVGLFLLIASVLGSIFAWRKFRSELVALEETIEELREDAVWLRELSRSENQETRETVTK